MHIKNIKNEIVDTDEIVIEALVEIAKEENVDFDELLKSGYNERQNIAKVIQYIMQKVGECDRKYLWENQPVYMPYKPEIMLKIGQAWASSEMNANYNIPIFINNTASGWVADDYSAVEEEDPYFYGVCEAFATSKDYNCEDGEAVWIEVDGKDFYSRKYDTMDEFERAVKESIFVNMMEEYKERLHDLVDGCY